MKDDRILVCNACGNEYKPSPYSHRTCAMRVCDKCADEGRAEFRVDVDELLDEYLTAREIRAQLEDRTEASDDERDFEEWL